MEPACIHRGNCNRSFRYVSWFFYAKEPVLAAAFAKTFPQARQVTDRKEILEDPSIQVILSSGIPVERAPSGREVMKYGRDYLSDNQALNP